MNDNDSKTHHNFHQELHNHNCFPVSPYNGSNIKNWFQQVEAIFALKRIPSDRTKFVSVIQVETPNFDEVVDTLENI